MKMMIMMKVMKVMKMIAPLLWLLFPKVLYTPITPSIYEVSLPMPDPKSEKNGIVMITVKMPRDLLETVDKAVELGYFPSRSEAIREGLRRLLRSLLFTLGPIKEIEEKIKKHPPKGNMPPEVFFMKYALDYVTENPIAEDFFTDYAEFITKTTLLLKENRKDDIKKLMKEIEEVLK